MIEKVCRIHGLTEHKMLSIKRPVCKCLKCYKDGMLRKAKADAIRSRSNKEYYMARLGGKCLDCGKSFGSWSMDFHHRDGAEKEYQISRTIKTIPNEEMLAEIDKCDLLCAVCHRKRHYYEDEKSVNQAPANRHSVTVKKMFIEAFGGKCHICGLEDKEEHAHVIYDFHHIDPALKEASASFMIKRHRAISDTAKELLKCVMICGVCHRDVHEMGTKIENKVYLNMDKVTEHLDKKNGKTYACITCGKEVVYGAKHCTEHMIRIKKVENRPTLEELTTFLASNSYLAAGRKYGVSDNAIRKWIKTMTK